MPATRLHSSINRPSSSARSNHSGRHTPHDHFLQLFDTDESLTRSVAAFLASGGRIGQSLLVVATKQHWNGIALRLASVGNTQIGLRADRVTFWDAEETLDRFMRRGEPNRALFIQHVAKAVIRLTEDASPGGLRIYGEMVELLAQEANYTGAAQLEQLWNELAQRCMFTLLCGYSAAHFASPDAGSALAAICFEHSHSSSSRSDPLGRFLLAAEDMRLASQSAR